MLFVQLEMCFCGSHWYARVFYFLFFHLLTLWYTLESPASLFLQVATFNLITYSPKVVEILDKAAAAGQFMVDLFKDALAIAAKSYIVSLKLGNLVINTCWGWRYRINQQNSEILIQLYKNII